MNRLTIKIYGEVQGVGLRYETKVKADKLGIKGFVRNEPDGTVFVEAFGREEDLNELLGWLEKMFATQISEIRHNLSNVREKYEEFVVKY
jgi:acylphosphatase